MQPIIPQDFGTCPDDMDTLEATDDYYGPPKSDRTIYDMARDDPAFAASLPKYWLAKDPAEAFADFVTSGIPQAVSRLMGQFGVEKHHKICDLGCGAGHLCYALRKLGYNVDRGNGPDSRLRPDS